MVQNATHGTTAPGFEPVAEAFARHAHLLGHGGGGYAACIAGEPVVDLWGGRARPDREWERDTITPIMSATKGLAGLCLQLLYERGQLDIDALVTDYWPEYGQAGKEATTVRQILLHTCGLVGFPTARDIIDWDGTGFDRTDDIEAAMAAAPPIWEPGSKTGYHAITYGWLVGALVRRITGQSLGTFFHDEYAAPLDLDIWIGTPASELPRVARLVDMRFEAFPRWLRGTYEKIIELGRDPQSFTGIAFLSNGIDSGVERLAEVLNSEKALLAEFPSGNGTANARSLARVMAVLANGGELDGRRYLLSATIERFSRFEGMAVDELSREIPVGRLLRNQSSKEVARTLGWLGNTPETAAAAAPFGPNPRSAGAQGAGGQSCFFDPDHQISVGYVRSDLTLVDALVPALNAELYACAARQGVVPKALVAPVGSSLGRAVGGLSKRYLARVQAKSVAAAPPR